MFLPALLHIIIINNFIQLGLFLTKTNSDVGLNTIELIEKYGYPVERHFVTTQDGYILQLHRIPHGKAQPINESKAKVPVFILHGLASSSADFVNHGNKSLGFLLADKGYDVWLGNSRGNVWSRNHTVLNPNFNKNRYWNFSWHEMGIFDLPVCIDYILEKTNQEKLHYICHSQGCTEFFVLVTIKPEFNDKIRLFTGLAPTAFMTNVKSTFYKFVANNLKNIQYLYQLLGFDEFLPSTVLNDILGEVICLHITGIVKLCKNVLLLIFGYDSTEIDLQLVPVIVSNIPAGAATKQVIHFAQGRKSKDFAQFDYGVAQNVVKYGQLKPPSYNLTLAKCPIAIYHGLNDIMVTPEDIDILIQHLNPEYLVRKHVVEYDKFNHIDFLWANHIIELVYNHVFDLMEKY